MGQLEVFSNDLGRVRGGNEVRFVNIWYSYFDFDCEYLNEMTLTIHTQIMLTEPWREVREYVFCRIRTRNRLCLHTRVV